MNLDYDSIVKENKRRRELLFEPYNALTGEGSPIERVKVCFMANNEQFSFYVPTEMYKDYGELIDMLNAEGSVEDVLKKTNQPCTPDVVNAFIQSFSENRFYYDFEFWAFTCVKIQDKKSKATIAFTLNKPQRKLLLVLLTMLFNGTPIRIILLKARQWGGSTLTQVFMAWMQIIRKKNWHSAIIADTDDQSRNIRGMYSRVAKDYPEVVGRITFAPYEQSQKNRIIIERNCIVGVGSAQKPDNLRSFDFAMLHLCLAKGTLIPTKDGFLKNVEDIIIGDKVITHTGQIATVKNVSSSIPSEYNGNGKAIKITPWLGHEITLTPNHPVFTNRGWVRADSLLKSDLLSMPVRKITENIKSIKLPYFPMRKRGGGVRPAGNGVTIELNKEIGFALGYYLAEGSLHKSKVGHSETTFTRHDSEVSYGDRAVNAITPFISSHVRQKRKGTLTTLEHCYGAPLAKWISNNLGIKEFKRVPDWFFDCGSEFLLGVLQGYLSGDGSKNNGKQRHYEITATSACTVSSSIATQIRDIAASLGFGWAAIDIRNAGYWYGRNCKKIHNVRWAGISAKNVRNAVGFSVPDNGRPRSEKTYIKDGYVWIKIRSISETKVDIVYDIEVDHVDHSFRTLYFSVKNSEVGLWKSTAMKSAEDLVQSVRATVPTVPDSMIVMESTAKGVGNFFHREWQSSVNGESSYQPVFVGWHEIEMYQKEIHVNYFSRFVKFVQTNEYAKFLWGLGATLEGIKWYFDHKKGENYDDWRMKSEYPSTAEEAFQSTGRRVFSQDYVLSARKSKAHPEYVGDISAKATKGKEAFVDITFKAEDKGLLYIWAMPDYSIDVSNRYVVVVDIGGRTEKADYSVIKVFDRYWMSEGGKPEVVATWRGHLDQDLVAWKAAQLSKMYCNALLVVEYNSLDTNDSEGEHHLTVLDEIVKFYNRIYARTEPDKVRQNVPVKYGFHTNRATKPMVIDELNGVLREGAYIERDVRACDEMDTYEIKKDGTYGAVDGCKDDLVMTTAIGVWICFKYLPIPKPIVKGSSSVSKQIISEASI